MKATLAQCAQERAHRRVRFLVLLQNAGRGKSAFARAAFVRPDTGVNGHVGGQRGPLQEAAMADGARERFDA